MSFLREPMNDEALGRLDDYFDDAQVGLHMVGGDGTILRANRADCAPIGLGQSDYVGHPITAFHADQAVIGDMLDRLLSDRPLINYTARLRGPGDDEAPVVICSNSRWQNGAFVNTRCYTRTLEPRTPLAFEASGRATAIADRQAHFHSLVDFFEESVPGVCAIDGDLTVRAANRSLLADLGRTAGEVVGMPFERMLDGAVGREALRALAGGTSLVDRGVALRARDGRIVRRLYATSRMNSGSFAGASVFLFDPDAVQPEQAGFGWPGNGTG